MKRRDFLSSVFAFIATARDAAMTWPLPVSSVAIGGSETLFGAPVHRVTRKGRGPAVSIRAHGALGNGAADDTAAWVSALAAGTHIILPAGIYCVNADALTLGTEDTIVQGAGPSLTIIRANTSGSNVLNVTGANVVISDCHIDGNHLSNRAIGFHGATDGQAVNVLATNCRTDAIAMLSGSERCKAVRCKATASAIGFATYGTSVDTEFLFCDVDGTTATNTAFGAIYLAGGERARVVSCVVTNPSSHCIFIDNCTDASVIGSTLRGAGNGVTENRRGISFGGGRRATAARAKIIGNLILESSETAIFTQAGGIAAWIAGNRCLNNNQITANGSVIEINSVDCQVLNNVVDGAIGAATAGISVTADRATLRGNRVMGVTGSGIKLFGPIDVLIENNVVRNPGGTGIDLNAGGVVRGLVVRGNRVVGATIGINVASANVRDCLVANNDLRGNTVPLSDRGTKTLVSGQ
jgi:hypothetical protein